MKRALWISIGLAAVTLVLYEPVAGHGFLTLDDPDYVSENPVVQRGLTAGGVVWAFTTGHAANWHPLTWLSLMLDVEVFGADPGALHRVNVVWHVVTSILLFLVLRRMAGAEMPAALVAALFAWHPTHVESVAWIAERKDVLSAFFWVLTMGAYARYAAGPTPGRYAATLASFALGLLAKPMLVTLPCVLLLLDAWPLRRVESRGWGRLLREKIPFFLLTVASSAATVWAQQRMGALEGASYVPLGGRVANAVVSWVRYVGKTLWPSDLAIYYPHPRVWPVWIVAVSVVILIVVTIAVLRVRASRPHLAVGWLWYLGTLIPVIGLVQVGSQSIADRYTYIPSIGLFVMLAWSLPLKGGGSRARIAAIGVAIVLVAAVVTTRAQLQRWKDDVTLFEHALSVTEDNVAAHLALARARLDRGELDAAAGQYRAALGLNENLADARAGIGVVLLRQGQDAAAARELEAAVRLDPSLMLARSNLGAALARLGRVREAVPHFEEAVRLDPASPAAHFNLGSTLAALGRADRAIEPLKRAVALAPTASARSRYQATLAMALAADGDTRAAREAAEAALASAREAGDAVQAERIRAWLVGNPE